MGIARASQRMPTARPPARFVTARPPIPRSYLLLPHRPTHQKYHNHSHTFREPCPPAFFSQRASLLFRHFRPFAAAHRPLIRPGSGAPAHLFAEPQHAPPLFRSTFAPPFHHSHQPPRPGFAPFRARHAFSFRYHTNICHRYARRRHATPRLFPPAPQSPARSCSIPPEYVQPPRALPLRSLRCEEFQHIIGYARSALAAAPAAGRSFAIIRPHRRRQRSPNSIISAKGARETKSHRESRSPAFASPDGR